MINPERYIGKVTLFANGAQLPTDFYMQYRNGRLSFLAETEMAALRDNLRTSELTGNRLAPAPRKSRPRRARSQTGRLPKDEPGRGNKIITSARQLAELVRAHRQRMESFTARSES